MMYPYITLDDETIITHSHLMGEGENKSVEVHFERPNDDGGFDTARCRIPGYEWIIRKGYNDKEMARFERLCRNAAGSFFRYAEEGGHGLA